MPDAESGPVRFIPARAGNSRTAPGPNSPTPVHPHACGEQCVAFSRRSTHSGSSPRVRGTVPCVRTPDHRLRFIPARAGNSSSPRRLPSRSSVHPRACGEQIATRAGIIIRSGSSPRVRGTASIPERHSRRDRFIPARAGNGRNGRLKPSTSTVHPRACGEQSSGRRKVISSSGSSPRVRGTEACDAISPRPMRFIPARAGNRSAAVQPDAPPPVHPRACGEQSTVQPAPQVLRGSSPRVRGTGITRSMLLAERRFIPARAGNSRRHRTQSSNRAVHPRACGEQIQAAFSQ